MSQKPSPSSEVPNSPDLSAEESAALEEALQKLTPAQMLFHSQAMALATGKPLMKGVNIRQYAMVGGKSVYAFLVKDLPDGPLVVLPMAASVNPMEEKVSFLMLVTSPISKLTRSSIVLETLPQGLPLLLYLEAAESLFDSCPGYFDESRRAKIKETTEIVRSVIASAAVPTPLDLALDEKFTKLAQSAAKNTREKTGDSGTIDVDSLDEVFGVKSFTPRVRQRKH